MASYDEASNISVALTMGVAVRAMDLLGGEVGLSAAEVEDWKAHGGVV